jgi:drug/metabolite transporter (DMT)-like permease
LTRHPLAGAYAALAAVCLFWGTTYLGIRVALETFPPLVLTASRFLLSGSLLLAACLAAGVPLGARREILRTARNGVIGLGVGAGCLTFSELWIPSSLAALFVSVGPFWMVGIEALVPGGERLRGPTLAGMTIGLGGAALLVAPAAIAEGFGGGVWRGFWVLQVGGAGWSLGSILQKRRAGVQHPVVSGAIQQLAAGLAFTPLAILIPSHPFEITARGLAAILYLATFGSIVGYTCYVIALERLPVSLVSVYTYVNPMVAAVLGGWMYREPFGRREIAAMAVILAGVAIVKRAGSRERAKTAGGSDV